MANPFTTPGELREAQQAAILATLAGSPDGSTAYELTVHIPVPQPTPDVQRRTGLLAEGATVTLAENLLGELEAGGKVRLEGGRRLSD